MSFNTAIGRAEYTASAAQTIFTFTFKIYNTSDVKVYLTPTGQTADDTADILIDTTDYTVTINGDDGGDVTLTSGATLNDAITLVRDLPVDRDIEYQHSGDLTAAALNEDQDYQTYLILDGSLKTNERALIIPDSAQDFDTTLPAPGADKMFIYASDGKSINLIDPSNTDLFKEAFIVNSMQALLGVDETTYGSVNIRGYYTINDGGGGLFNWDSTVDKSTANAGTIIDPGQTLANQGDGTGNGCWVRQYSGAVNVKWFGAKGDGATDDTTAINTSLTVSPSVFIPTGTYLVSKSYDGSHWDDKSAILITDNNRKLFGEGSDNTSIVLADNSDCHVIKFGLRMGSQVIVDYCEISGISIDGNKTNQSSPTATDFHWGGIDVVNGCSNISIKNMIVKHTQYYGIGFQTQGFTDCSIQDCIITDTNADGIDWKDSLADNSGNSITNVIVKRFGLFDRTVLVEQAGVNVRGGVSLDGIKVSEFNGDRKGIRIEIGLSLPLNKNYGPLSNFEIKGGTNTIETGSAALYRTGLDIGNDTVNIRPLQISNGRVYDLVSGNSTSDDIGMNVRSEHHNISNVNAISCDIGIKLKSYIRLVNSSASECATGIFLNGAYSQLANIYTDLCTEYGLYVNSGLITISNITSINNTGIGVYIGSGSTSSSLIGGVIRDNATDITDNGVNTIISKINNVITESTKTSVFGVASVVVRNQVVPHGLEFTPLIKDIITSISSSSGDTDYQLGVIQVSSVDATNVNVAIPVTVASANGSASAQLNVYSKCKYI